MLSGFLQLHPISTFLSSDRVGPRTLQIKCHQFDKTDTSRVAAASPDMAAYGKKGVDLFGQQRLHIKI